MAYLRKEKETVEIDYALEKVWKTVRKTLKELKWAIEQIDDVAHTVRAKTPQGLISWSSVMQIEATQINENTTRVSVAAETPVTTISAIVDFGRARRRVDLFFATMAKQMAK